MLTAIEPETACARQCHKPHKSSPCRALTNPNFVLRPFLGRYARMRDGKYVRVRQRDRTSSNDPFVIGLAKPGNENMSTVISSIYMT